MNKSFSGFYSTEFLECYVKLDLSSGINPIITPQWSLSEMMPKIYERINIRRISILKKPADIQYLGGFWGDKSRGTKNFLIRAFLTLTGPLVKIGGQKLILKSYQYWYDNMFYRF